MRFKKLLLVGLWLALLLSVAANFVLLHAAKSYYAQALDPVGLGAFEDTDTGGTILFGDSRISEWPTHLLTPLGKARNRGIRGHSTEQCAHRFEQHVLSAAPETLVMQMGVNDLKAIGLFPERRDEIVRTCISNIQSFVDRASEAGSDVVLFTIFPVGEVSLSRRLVWSEEIKTAIAQVNRELLAMETKGVQVIDAGERLEAVDGRIDPAYNRDLLHLNETGYKQLMPALVQTISAFAEQ